MAGLTIPLLERGDIPSEVAAITPAKIREVFAHPTFIDLEPTPAARGRAPLFVSLLLHGNEHTSLAVLQKLKDYLSRKPLLRPLKIFVGNVYAAAANRRHLPDQLDYNRIWRGGAAPEEQLAERVIARALKDGPLFASIDVHNNTGKNPLYGCICRLEPRYIYLASLFSHTTVYFRHPKTVQSIVFADHCPAITLECGRSLEPLGIERAYQLIVDVLAAESLDHPVKDHGAGIFQTLARLVIRDDVSYDFDSPTAALSLPQSLEDKNFSPLQPGETFAIYRGEGQPFAVRDIDDNDLFPNYFKRDGDKIVVTAPWYGSMFTKDLEVIRQDCLGYLMTTITP